MGWPTRQRAVPEQPWTCSRHPETLYCAPSPEKRLLGQPRQNRECHSSGTFRRVKYPATCSKNLYEMGALLRNRTVDLLLTMDLREVPLPQAGHLIRQNTSTDQRPQAPIRLSRAQFAAQSATHFDLVLVARAGCRTVARHPWRAASGDPDQPAHPAAFIASMMWEAPGVQVVAASKLPGVTPS